MTKKEFSNVAAALRAVYTNDNFLATEESVNIWYQLLKDMDYPTLMASAQNFMQTETRLPTPADLRRKAVNLTLPSVENEGEAWAKVLKAIRKANYYAEEEFNKFSPEIQRAVGSASQLRSWAMDEDFNESVVASNFKRVYRIECERKSELNRMSEGLRQLITSNNQKLLGGE